MKKLLAFTCLILVLVSLVSLVGCGCGEDDVPPDHQLASKPEVDGFTLYIPEEWKYTRVNGVITAHVSSLNTMAFTAARVETTHESMDAYWEESERELIALLENKPKDSNNPDAAPVSSYNLEKKRELAQVNNHVAYFYEYTGIFPSKIIPYRVLQYFILVGNTPKDGMIVLTLTGADVAKDSTGEKDFNETMRTKFMRMLEVFEVGHVTDAENGNLTAEDKHAPDGMKSATLNKHLGMTVYVPEAWRVNVSDGFIGVTSADGYANIGVTNVSFTGTAGGQYTFAERMEYYGISMASPENGISLMDYWNLTKAECRAYFDEGTFVVDAEPEIKEEIDENGNKKFTSVTPPTVAGETTYYTYRFHGMQGGERYDMTLCIFRETDGWFNNQFRSLLLTSHSATHDTYLADVARILAEVRY